MNISKQLIVLDLDETLFHCSALSLDNYHYKFRLGNNTIYYVVKRPFVDDFISYINENYEYGVYTAASEDYAKKHCINLDLTPKFILHQKNCEIRRDPYGNEYLLKELSKLTNYSLLSNMIAIDDRYESYSENKSNLIKVKPFYCDLRDDILLKLIEYLKSIKDVKDVRSIDKEEWDT